MTGDGLAGGEPGRRPPWRDLRAALQREGFRPSRGRGQNFLIDPNLQRAIVRDAGVGPGDRVLEVGVGCGFTARPLLERGVEWLGVEVDARLARIARRSLEAYGAVRLLETDVLASKHALDPHVQQALAAWGEPYHVVSNLPYAIAGPLLVLLARAEPPPSSITVLVQRELGERIAARPGTRAWGALAARLALGYESRLGRTVGRELFWPRPRVDSVVVGLRRRPEVPPRPLQEAYERLVAGVFRFPRRQLRGALAGLASDREEAERWLARAGVDPRRRPGELSRRELLALAANL